MRAASTAMLVVGFGIGFGVMYTYISPKAADIVKPIPQFVPQGAAAPAAATNPAVVRQLEVELRRDPKNFEALRNLGDIRYDERNYTDAADFYARALEVHPDDVDVRAYRGGALLQNRKIDEAIAELKIVLSKQPTHPQALYIVGVALDARGDHKDAIASWKKLIESHPELPELDIVREQIRRAEEAASSK